MSSHGSGDPYFDAAMDVHGFLFGTKRSAGESEVVSAARYDSLVAKQLQLAGLYEEQGKSVNRLQLQMLIMMREYVIQAGLGDGARVVQAQVARDVLELESGRSLNLGLASSRSQSLRAEIAASHAEEVIGSMLEFFVRTRIISEEQIQLQAWPTRQDLQDLYLVEIEGVALPGVQPASKVAMPVDSQWLKSIMTNESGARGVQGDSPLAQIMRKNGTYETFEQTEGAKMALEIQLKNKSRKLLEEERLATEAAERATQGRPGMLRRLLGGGR